MIDGSFLLSPQVVPVLDAGFRPAILAQRAFTRAAKAFRSTAELHIALEQADGSISRHSTLIFPESHAESRWNFYYVERLIKFLLWSRGGFRIYLSGPKSLADQLRRHFLETATGKFDSNLIGQRVYEKPIDVVSSQEVPAERATANPLGRHLDGCRIGFDLGASDRKVAALLNGECVFTEEMIWSPVAQSDPQWHFDQIMESLRLAARHLPRVDAIGGSSAGVYVNNRVKVASLFRGVPLELFNRRVKDLFLEMRQAWGNIPFEVANDGEVTALAGSMAMRRNGVLGIALGSSLAGGYVNPEGNITTWLNELAFAPVDYNPNAPPDEWSGDIGCGVQYFSQQCVARLLPAAGIELDSSMSVPEKLKEVQKLMLARDERARKIYQTIGTYLGYAVAQYTEFYEFNDVLILGRVTTGQGGDLIVAGAQEVLQVEFPEIATRIAFHLPDEKEKRHGQAIAAASLPAL